MKRFLFRISTSASSSRSRRTVAHGLGVAAFLPLGTTEAAAQLIEKQGAVVSQFSFLIGLKDLNGEKKLEQFNAEVYSILNY